MAGRPFQPFIMTKLGCANVQDLKLLNLHLSRAYMSAANMLDIRYTCEAETEMI